MSELSELYQQVILDHNRQPRNFRKLENATAKAEGYNPLCGDRIVVYIEMENDLLQNVSFEGSGCAISKASASMMTQSVKGKHRNEIEELFRHVHAMLTAPPETGVNSEKVGKLAVFSGVREFPVRVKCATLAWHTLNAALQGTTDQKISTE